MIFLLICVGYVIVAVIMGKLFYTSSIDHSFSTQLEEQKKRTKNADFDNFSLEEKQQVYNLAMDNVKHRDMSVIRMATALVVAFWPLRLVLWLCFTVYKLTVHPLLKLLPSSKAEKLISSLDQEIADAKERKKAIELAEEFNLNITGMEK